DADEDRPASRVADPAPKDSWHGLRPHARPAVHSTERFDAHAEQSNSPRPGVLSGATTLVRTQVRRIQAPNGQWVRDYTLNLPVNTDDPSLSGQLQDRITGLLDTHLNSGLALPGSGDQLHINLNLISDPAHPEAITLTNTANPDRADQLHLDANHSDEDLLHEVLHYLGLPDEQRDNDFLLRNHPNSTTVHTTGVMATTQTPVHIPHRYLRTIENVTATGPRLHDHAGQDETTPVRDPDTTPIPTDTPLTWPTSNAPVAAPSSAFVLDYGSQRDGNVGLVLLEPLSAEVVSGLHQQVMTALGLGDAADTHPVREQLRTVASEETLVLNLPHLRGSPGFRIRVTVGGRDRDVDLRMRLSDPQEEPEGDPQAAHQQPEFQQGSAGNGTGEEPEDDQDDQDGEGGEGDQAGRHGQRGRPGDDVDEDGLEYASESGEEESDEEESDDEDSDVDEGDDGANGRRGEGSRTTGSAVAWTRTRDPHTALLAWARADVVANGAPDDVALPAPDTLVGTDALAEIGALTEELRAQSILQNGMVTVAEAGLDDAARLALVLARPDSDVYVSTLAALVARDTGRPVLVLGPDDRTRRFGPADGTPLTLYFDGNRFSVNPPVPDDD
ncbi:hypothetical protein ACWDEW_17520, partial [Streptomyces sp. NPDC001100]